MRLRHQRQAFTFLVEHLAYKYQRAVALLVVNQA
jgi:hypothetical protein